MLKVKVGDIVQHKDTKRVGIVVPGINNQELRIFIFDDSEAAEGVRQAAKFPIYTSWSARFHCILSAA